MLSSLHSRLLSPVLVNNNIPNCSKNHSTKIWKNIHQESPVLFFRCQSARPWCVSEGHCPRPRRFSWNHHGASGVSHCAGRTFASDGSTPTSALAPRCSSAFHAISEPLVLSSLRSDWETRPPPPNGGGRCHGFLGAVGSCTLWRRRALTWWNGKERN